MTDVLAMSAALAKKLLLVQTDMERISRDGTGPKAQGSYKYISAEAIKDRFGPSCIEHGISTRTAFQSLSPWDAKIKVGQADYQFVLVRCTITLTDVDTGYSVEISAEGSGSDSNDKHLFKAQTSAHRDAIKQSFNVCSIEDKDEPGDVEHPRNNGEHRQERPRHPMPAPSPSMPAAVEAAKREPLKAEAPSSSFVLTWGSASGKKVADVPTPLLQDYHRRLSAVQDPKKLVMAKHVIACIDKALGERAVQESAA